MLSNNTTESATALLALGIAPMPVQWKAKLPMMKAWQKEYPRTPDDLSAYFDTQDLNIGAVLGAASGGKVDIDMDWPECERLARLFLPQSWTFGRMLNGGLHVRHIMLQCPDIQTLRLTAPPSMRVSGDKARIVEVLSTGTFVVAPGSIYADGQPIQWISGPSDVPLAEMDAAALTQAVKRMAGAALMARLWPELEGTRHDVLLALAGSMAHAGWVHEQIAQVLWGVVCIGRDPEKADRKKAIFDTLQKISSGAPVSGLPTLSAHVGTDIIDRLVKWWDLGSQGAGLIFNSPLCQPEGPGATAFTWPELLEFEACTAYNHEVDSYPVEQLGAVMGGAVQALVDRQQVPAPLAAQSVLSAACTAVHSRYDVNCDGRAVPTSLWLVLVAEPGERKTSTDTIAFDRLFTRLHEAEATYEVALSAWKAQLADKAIVDLGLPPRAPVWLLTDSTTEGLLKSLHKHWPAITLTNSDAASWLSGYSMREGRDSSTAGTFSQLWSGGFQASAKASLDIPAVMHHRRVALSLMLQPVLAAQLFENPTLSGQGFLSRCLPAFPASTIGMRLYRKPQRDTRLDAFYSRLDDLLLISPDMNAVTGALQPMALALDDAAYALWVKLHDKYEVGLIQSYAPIREVANKAAEQVLRLAGVQAVMEGADTITAGVMWNAGVLMDWHMEQWAELSVRLVEHRKEVAMPRQLWEWMLHRRQTSNQTVFNLREIYKAGPRIVRNQSQLARELVTELLRRGYVRLLGKDYEMRPDHEQ